MFAVKAIRDAILRDSVRIEAPMREKSTIANDFNRAGTEFLKVEIETGLSFASIALSEEPGSEKRIRNQGNAVKAYQTVLRLRGRVENSDDTNRAIQNALDHLRSALQKLGENVNSGC